jgi:hypothetical protein
MDEELPFTDAIANYVRAESRPWLTVAFIFGGISILPALLTVVFLVQGRLFDRSLLVVFDASHRGDA